MNFRTTLILLLLLIGIGVFFLVAHHSGETPIPRSVDEAAQGIKIIDLKTDDVHKLLLKPGPSAPAGAPTIEMINSDGKWKLTSPVDWAADSMEARNLVDSIVDLRSHGKVDLTGETAVSTGLKSPRYTIALTDNAGKTTTLLVGKPFELGRDLYVSTDNGASGEVVGGGTLTDKLDEGSQKLAATLRDKQLITLSSADVEQIELTHGAEKLHLDKVGADWKLTAPEKEPADAGEVSDLLETITGLRADEYVSPSSPDAADAGFGKPRAVIWLSTTAATTRPSAAKAHQIITITIGEPTDVNMDKSFVRVSTTGAIAKVAITAATLDKIVKASPLTLRDKKALDIDPQQVSEISLRMDRPATTQPTSRPAELRNLEIARRKESLELGPALPPGLSAHPAATEPTTRPGEEPTTRPAEPTTRPSEEPTTRPSTRPTTGPSASADWRPLVSPVAALIGEVTADSAPADKEAHPSEAHPTPAPAGATAPTSTTAPTTEESKLPPATRPTGPETEPTAAATEPTPTTGPATGPALIAHKPAKPVLPSLPPTPVSKWVISSEAGVPADDEQVTDLLDALHPLRVESYVASPKPIEHPVATYVLTVKTVAAGGASAATYEIKIIDPGSDAKLIGEYKDLHFELDRSLLKKLDGDFKTRRAVETTPPPSFPRGGAGFPGPGGFHGGE